MNSPHDTGPTVTWVCPIDGNRRDVPSAHVGGGAPACPVCKTAMVPPVENVDPFVTDTSLIPGLAKALAKRESELQQEPEVGA